MYQPYNEQNASVQDRIAWALCQIIDDDAPMRWTRFRFAAECIAWNDKLMANINALREQKAANASVNGASGKEESKP